MINKGFSPRKIVRLKIIPITMARTMPSMYSDQITVPAWAEKKRPANRAQTGSLAPQDMRGISNAVRILSLGFSKVRVA